MTEDLKSRVTRIPSLDENDAQHEIALPRVPSSPDLSDPGLTETGESTVVADVRQQTGAVLGFGEIVLPEGERPEDDTEPLEEESVKPKKEPLPKEFEKAILDAFKDLADNDRLSVYLDFGSFDVRVLSDHIDVHSSTELGDAEAEDSYNQPTIPKIIEELFRAEALCNALIPKGYYVRSRGDTADGYYEVTLRKGIVFETKEDIVGYLQYLKTVLEEVDVQNSIHDSQPAPT